MYSTASMNLEGVDHIFVNAYFNDIDTSFSLSVSAVGHSITINDISQENLEKVADVINRVLATKDSSSSVDDLLV